MLDTGVMNMVNPSSHPRSGASPFGNLFSSMAQSMGRNRETRRSQQFQVGLLQLQHQLGQQAADADAYRTMAVATHKNSLPVSPAQMSQQEHAWNSQQSKQAHAQTTQESAQQHAQKMQRAQTLQDRWNFRNREKPAMDWALSTLQQGTPQQQQAAATSHMQQTGASAQKPKPGP